MNEAQKLPMSLGGGFSESAITSDRYRLVLGGRPFRLSDLGFAAPRPIAVGSGHACDIAYDAVSQTIYFRDEGIRSLRLQEGHFDAIASAELATVVLDVLSRTVHQIPGAHAHNVTWVDVGFDEVHASLSGSSS